VAGQPIRLAAKYAAVEDKKAWEFSGLAELKHPPDLKDLINKIASDIPDEMIPSISLEKVFIGYIPDPMSFTLICRTTLFDAFAAFFEKQLKDSKPKTICVVGLEVPQPIPLSNIPGLSKVDIIKSFLGQTSVDQVKIAYASDALQQQDLLRPKSWDTPSRTPRKPDEVTQPLVDTQKIEIKKGFSLRARIGGYVLNFDTPEWPEKQREAGTQQKSDKEQQPLAEPAVSGVLRKWFDVKKTLGPVHLRRVGVELREWKKLGFLLDASVDLAGLTIGLIGFRISFPLVEFIQKPEAKTLKKIDVGLDGLEVGFKQGPVQISGTLLEVPDPANGVSVRYDGSLIVRAKAFTLTALGSYAVVDGQASLFVFAVLHRELGGPAFFFVTGLAFGFGFNRALKLPPIEEVQNFPLIKGATDPDYFGGGSDPGAALQKLQDYIAPSPGNYWLAAGVKFTSFGMIDSFALISVSFGTQFQIALLGISRITVPRQVPGASAKDPVACAELAIKVTFTQASGLLAAEARLTDNSYIFSKNCKLTGGFAFYCWFGPEHEGDFVVTLGGYHPRFQRPDHYPVVPRLRIYWPISSNLSVLGEAYFALTPSCLMAGGKLEAVYQAGNLRAWFVAHADFLINWKPFYYDIEIGVRIGVSYRFSFFGIRTTLSIELGASVHIWGPPFGGRARISLWIISFTISFGQRRIADPPRLSWEEFHQSFLPPSEAHAAALETAAEPDPLVCIIRITSGLIREKDVEEGGGKRKTLKVMNAHEFSLTTESLIPSTGVRVTNCNATEDGQTNKVKPLGIRPMGMRELNSEHTVTFTKKDENVKDGWDKYIQHSLTRKNFPYALWSNDTSRLSRPSAETIKDVVCGVRVSLKHREPSHGLASIDLKKFEYEDIPKAIGWKEFTLPEIIPAPGKKTLMNTIWGCPAVDKKRNAILETLKKVKPQGSKLQEVNMPNLAKNAREMFQAMPEMAVPGQPMT
jgi:hypothetical protein